MWVTRTNPASMARTRTGKPTPPTTMAGSTPPSERKLSPAAWRATLRRSVSVTRWLLGSTSQNPRVAGSPVATVEASRYPMSACLPLPVARRLSTDEPTSVSTGGIHRSMTASPLGSIGERGLPTRRSLRRRTPRAAPSTGCRSSTRTRRQTSCSSSTRCDPASTVSTASCSSTRRPRCYPGTPRTAVQAGRRMPASPEDQPGRWHPTPMEMRLQPTPLMGGHLCSWEGRHCAWNPLHQAY